MSTAVIRFCLDFKATLNEKSHNCWMSNSLFRHFVNFSSLIQNFMKEISHYLKGAKTSPFAVRWINTLVRMSFS